MANKLQEMNKMKADLREQGVDVSRSWSYDKLKKVHEKHCGGSTGFSRNNGGIFTSWHYNYAD